MKHLPVFLIFLSLISCSKQTFRSKWTRQIAPASFAARFETSKGNFDIEVTSAWSPKAADRLYQLLQHRFYDHILFYRVVPDFVVQFGNTDTTIAGRWDKFKVPDEPVLKSNLKGYISFARAEKDTRGNHLFINLKDNPRLDTLNYENVTGFPVFGMVTKGMEVVEMMYSGYGNQTMDVYDSLSGNRAKYLGLFPKLDSINSAYILSPFAKQN